MCARVLAFRCVRVARTRVQPNWETETDTGLSTRTWSGHPRMRLWQGACGPLSSSSISGSAFAKLQQRIVRERRERASGAATPLFEIVVYDSMNQYRTFDGESHRMGVKSHRLPLTHNPSMMILDEDPSLDSETMVEWF